MTIKRLIWGGLWFVLSLIVTGQYSLFGQDDETEPKLESVVQPLMWVLDTEPPSYLFGTIHITDERCTTLHPLVQEAFDQCDTLFLETSPKDALRQLTAITLSDRGTKDVLPAEIIERIDQQLKDMGSGLTHRTQPPYKVYAWGLVLPAMEVQLKNPQVEFLDLKLASLAKQAGKKVDGLEDPKEQLKGMDALSEEEQLQFLKSSLEAMEEADETGEELETEVAEYYLRGDTDELEEYFNSEMVEDGLDPELAAKIMNALLHERNERMAKKIAETLQAHPDEQFFFAAGAAHYIGEKSVQHYLQQLGIRAERVMTEELAGVGDE